MKTSFPFIKAITQLEQLNSKKLTKSERVQALELLSLLTLLQKSYILGGRVGNKLTVGQRAILAAILNQGHALNDASYWDDLKNQYSSKKNIVNSLQERWQAPGLYAHFTAEALLDYYDLVRKVRLQTEASIKRTNGIMNSALSQCLTEFCNDARACEHPMRLALHYRIKKCFTTGNLVNPSSYSFLRDSFKVYRIEASVPPESPIPEVFPLNRALGDSYQEPYLKKRLLKKMALSTADSLVITHELLVPDSLSSFVPSTLSRWVPRFFQRNTAFRRHFFSNNKNLFLRIAALQNNRIPEVTWGIDDPYWHDLSEVSRLLESALKNLRDFKVSFFSGLTQQFIGISTNFLNRYKAQFIEKKIARLENLVQQQMPVELERVYDFNAETFMSPILQAIDVLEKENQDAVFNRVQVMGRLGVIKNRLQCIAIPRDLRCSLQTALSSFGEKRAQNKKDFEALMLSLLVPEAIHKPSIVMLHNSIMPQLETIFNTQITEWALYLENPDTTSIPDGCLLSQCNRLLNQFAAASSIPREPTYNFDSLYALSLKLRRYCKNMPLDAYSGYEKDIKLFIETLEKMMLPFVKTEGCDLSETMDAVDQYIGCLDRNEPPTTRAEQLEISTLERERYRVAEAKKNEDVVAQALATMKQYDDALLARQEADELARKNEKLSRLGVINSSNVHLLLLRPPNQNCDAYSQRNDTNFYRGPK